MKKQQYALKEHSHNYEMLMILFMVLLILGFVFINDRLKKLESKVMSEKVCEDVWESVGVFKLGISKEECFDMINKNDNIEVFGWDEEGYCNINIKIKQKCSEDEKDE